MLIEEPSARGTGRKIVKGMEWRRRLWCLISMRFASRQIFSNSLSQSAISIETHLSDDGLMTVYSAIKRENVA
jgi:hypothetical protein